MSRAALDLSRDATVARLRAACPPPNGLWPAELEQHVQRIADDVMNARRYPRNPFATRVAPERLTPSIPKASNGPAASEGTDSAAGPPTKGR